MDRKVFWTLTVTMNYDVYHKGGYYEGGLQSEASCILSH